MPTLVKDIVFDLALNKEVLKKFPDAQLTSGTYYSKLVNKNYNKFNINSNYDRLDLDLMYESDFIFDNETYGIVVCGTGKKRYNLAHTTCNEWKPTGPNIRDFIYISDYLKDFKKYKVRSDVLGDVRLAVINFIKAYPTLKFDKESLEPRLRDLIIFS